MKHGRFFYSRAVDCKGCDLAALCLSKGRANKAVVAGDDYPALLRARRRRDRWTDEDRRLYQRHRWRSEGYHGEAKTWHGLHVPTAAGSPMSSTFCPRMRGDEPSSGTEALPVAPIPCTRG